MRRAARRSRRLDADHDETYRVVHEELGRLPERLRAAIACCYLEGMTHELAAAQLGCPVGTVRSRLARARARLKVRLARRGVTLADETLGMLLLSSCRTQLPARLLRSTLRSRSILGVQSAGTGVVPASVLGLVEGALKPMVFRKVAFPVSSACRFGAYPRAGAVWPSRGGETPSSRCPSTNQARATGQKAVAPRKNSRKGLLHR